MSREERNFVPPKEGFLFGRVNTRGSFDFVFGAEDKHSLLNGDVHRGVIRFELKPWTCRRNSRQAE